MLCYYNFRAMPKTEKKVNQKYCKLLSETFEKYKDRRKGSLTKQYESSVL